MHILETVIWIPSPSTLGHISSQAEKTLFINTQIKTTKPHNCVSDMTCVRWTSHKHRVEPLTNLPSLHLQGPEVQDTSLATMHVCHIYPCCSSCYRQLQAILQRVKIPSLTCSPMTANTIHDNATAAALAQQVRPAGACVPNWHIKCRHAHWFECSAGVLRTRSAAILARAFCHIIAASVKLWPAALATHAAQD